MLEEPRLGTAKLFLWKWGKWDWTRAAGGPESRRPEGRHLRFLFALKEEEQQFADLEGVVLGRKLGERAALT